MVIYFYDNRFVSYKKAWTLFLHTFKGFAKNKKQMYALIFASLIVTANWFIYIWAVNNGHMIEASLGYYINPLVSILIRDDCFKRKIKHLPIYCFLNGGHWCINHLRFPW